MDGQARLGLFGVEWLNMNVCRRFRTYACKLLCKKDEGVRMAMDARMS